MALTRQQILFICLSSPELDSKTIAWALYDGTLPRGELQMGTGTEEEPAYSSVLDAMRDGWKVIQAPSMPRYAYGHENDTGHLPWEYMLAREVEIDG